MGKPVWSRPPWAEVGESLKIVCDAINKNQELVVRETDRMLDEEEARLAEAGEDTANAIGPMHESDHVQMALTLLHEAVVNISEHLWPGFCEHQKIRLPEVF